MRHTLWLALTLVATGCNTVTQNQYIVRQSALVPGVKPPLITGSALPSGRFSISGAAQVGSSNSSKSRDDGGIGSVIADASGRFAIAYSTALVDIAAGLELHPASLAHSAAADLSPDQFKGAWLVYPTVAFRVRKPQSTGLESGIIFELSLASLPYCRNTITVSKTTTYNSDGTVSMSRWSGSDSYTDRVWMPIFRIGPSLSWQFKHGFGLTIGVLFENEPYVEGVSLAKDTCYSNTGSPATSCHGTNPSDIPVLQYAFGAIPFVSPSFQAGPVRFIAQIFGNLTTEQRLMQADPYGAELRVQASF